MIWTELQKKSYERKNKKNDIEVDYKKVGMKEITKKMRYQEGNYKNSKQHH